MTVIYIAVAVALLAAAVFIASGIFFFNTASLRDEDDPRDFYDRIYEKLHGTEREYLIGEFQRGRRFYREHAHINCEIKSYDGIRLCARLFENEGADVTVICFHGHRSAAYIDFPVQMKKFYDMGYNVLAVSQRASNDSDGKYICFGVKERFDASAWCGYVTDRYGGGHRIILFGLSMGASTVLMSSELEGVNGRVSGIIADCGYTSPEAQFRYLIRYQYGLSPFPFINIAGIVSWICAGWRFCEADAVRSVKKTTVPILFIHGNADGYVPHSFTLDTYEACSSRKELLIVDGASHGFSFYASPEVYEAKINEFLRSVL